MGLLNSVKAAVLFGCILFANSSYAAVYTWGYGFTPQPYSPTASGACPSTIGKISGETSTFSRVDMRSPTYGVCVYSYGSDGYMYYASEVHRSGDECAPGTGPYDPTKGECPAAIPDKKPGEKCDDQTGASSQNPFIYDKQAGKCVKFFEAGQEASCKYLGSAGYGPAEYTVAGNLDSGGSPVAPPTFTSNTMDCQVKTVTSSDCVVAATDGAITCNVTAVFTGEMNNGSQNSADALCPNGKCLVKEPETKTKDEGCTPVGDGSGGSSCTQVKETDQQGSQQCGLVNGAYKCFSKPPYKNGLITSIKSTSETLPDGSIKVTTVKDSSNIVCTDVKKCTTSTSSTTTHTTTKPNGSTSTDTSCKGACSPNGGGLETNPAAGSGNAGNGSGGGGTGGNGDGEGEGGDGTASTTDLCSATPPCDGDPFLCAILKQDHIDTCKLMADATPEQKAATESKIANAYAQLDAHQAKLDSDVTGLLSKFQSDVTSGGGGGAKCLPDKQFSVGGLSMEIPFSKTCDSLAWVRIALVACAYLFAARIVSRVV